MDDFLVKSYRKKQASKPLAAALDAHFLGKVASGKVAFCHDEGSSEWAQKFQGTPLFGQAIALMQQMINTQIEQDQEDMARTANPIWQRVNRIRNQMKLLDLQLLQAQAQADMPAEQNPMSSGTPMDGSQSIAPGQTDMKMAALNPQIEQMAMQKLHELGSYGGRVAATAALLKGVPFVAEKMGPAAERLVTREGHDILQGALPARASGLLHRLGEIASGDRVKKLERAAGVTEALPKVLFGPTADAVRGEATREALKGLALRTGVFGAGAAIPLAMHLRKQEEMMAPEHVLAPTSAPASLDLGSKLAAMVPVLGKELASRTVKEALGNPGGFQGAWDAGKKIFGGINKGDFATKTLIGAGVGGLAGVASGDENTGMGTRIMRGALGAGVGGLAGGVASNYAKTNDLGKAFNKTTQNWGNIGKRVQKGYQPSMLHQATEAAKDIPGTLNTVKNKVVDAAGNLSEGVQQAGEAIKANAPAIGAAAGAMGAAGAVYAPAVKSAITEVKALAASHPQGILGAMKDYYNKAAPELKQHLSAFMDNPAKLQETMTQLGHDLSEGGARGVANAASNLASNVRQTGQQAAQAAAQNAAQVIPTGVQAAENVSEMLPWYRRVAQFATGANTPTARMQQAYNAEKAVAL